MKKYFYIILAAAAIVASCTNEELKEGQKSEVKDGASALFSGSIIQPEGLEALTKVSIAYKDSNHVGIVWDEGDQISVYGKSTNTNNTFSAQSAGPKVHFSNANPASVAQWLAENDNDGYEAYYPADTDDEQITESNAGSQSANWTLDCDQQIGGEHINQASLQNMPLYGVSGTIDASKNERPLTFSSNYAILQIGIPGGKGIKAMDVCVNGENALAVTVNNIDALAAAHDSVIYVPILPLASGITSLTFKAYGEGYDSNNPSTKETSKIAQMDTYDNSATPNFKLDLEANTIYPFDFCNTLTISEEGTYNLDEKFTNGLDCRINISTNITGEVNINATEASNIFVNVRTNTVGTLNIDAPNSHVEVENGTATSVNAKTSNSTFVAKETFEVTTLTVQKGSVVVKGKTNEETNVKKIIIPGSVTEPIKIDVSGVSSASEDKRVEIVNNSEATVIVVPDKVGGGETQQSYKTSGSGPVVEASGEDVAINGTTQDQYSSLADAITAVGDGQTIILLKDVDNAKGITVPEDKNFTVDFGGHTYTCAGEPAGSTNTKNQVFQLLQNSTITFKNGTINVAESAKAQFRFIIQNYANLTLEDIILDGTNLAITDRDRYTISNNCGTVEFKGATTIKAAAERGVAFDVCKYASYDAPTVTWNSTGSVDGIIELSGGTFKLDADLCVNAPVYVTSSNKSTLNLNGKKIYNTSDIWEQDSAKKWFELIKVDGGKLTINDTSNGSVAAKQNDCYAVNVINEGELEINGGTFKGNVSAVQVDKGTATINAGSFEQQQGTQYDKYLLNCVDENYKAKTASIIVKGGSFKGFNPADNAAEGAGTNFVAEGYTSTGNNGVWTVAEFSGVAKIGSTGYATLAAAIAAVKDNETIVLLANVTDANGISVPENKKFTVDFGGYTYTGLDNPAGSTGTTNQVFQLRQGSTITFKNGTINVATTNSSKFRFIIQNYANLTLEDIILDGTNLAITDRDRYTISNNCGTVEFKGATTIKAAAERGVAFDVCKYASYDAPTVTWSSTGTVDGTIELSGGEFILGHNLEVKQPIKVVAPATLDLVDYTLSAASGFTRPTAGVIIVNRKGDLTINGNTNGTINAGSVYAAVLMTEKNVDTGDTTNVAKITVNSGTLIGETAGISGNGSTGRGNTVITINGGTIKGTQSDDCAGIFHPQSGILNIQGGTIEGAVGVYVKSGKTVITGGTIKGVGTDKAYSHSGNGFNPTGDAFVVENCGYPGGVPSVSISGGTFESTNGKQVGNYGYLPTYQPITIDYQGTPLTERTNVGPATTGTAKATIGGVEKDVKWIQLWKDGPKFAEYNVGVTDGKATSYGGYFPWASDIASTQWGADRRMPTYNEFQALIDNCTLEKKTNFEGSGVTGWLCTGKGDYSDNSVFFPAAGLDMGEYGKDDVNNKGYYLTSEQTPWDSPYFMIFTSAGSPDCPSVIGASDVFSRTVRAVYTK